MPAIARLDDVVGGISSAKLIPTATKTFVNGKLVIRLGDLIASHGTNEHIAATMIEASSTVFAEGIAVCRLGDKASCDHVITSASPDSFAGG